MTLLFLLLIVGLVVAVTILSLYIVKLKQQPKPVHVGSTVLASNLRDEKLKSGIILNSIEDGVVLIDKDGVIQLFNPAAGAITGWEPDEAHGLKWSAVIKLVDNKGEEYADADNPFRRAFTEAQTIRDNSATLVSRATNQIAVSLSISPLWDETKQITAVVAILRDVTEQRQEEKQRTEFISTASHEMRTPVAAIEGYLALALNDKVSTVDTRARGFLEKAHTSTEHLGKLFQDLLTSAKAEDGRLTSHPVIIEIGAFLEQLTNDLKFVAEKKGLLMEFNLGSSETIDATNHTGSSRVIKPLYYIKADPDRLREVVTNIFDNAVKYTDSGKVSVGLTGDDQVVQFYVRDTGPGIPTEDIPHLFQKFYRVDNSATRTIGGTGLGLFISRKVVELYQGRIWVESTIGKGSTFFINFPRLSTVAATKEQAQEARTVELQPINSLTATVIQ